MELILSFHTGTQRSNSCHEAWASYWLSHLTGSRTLTCFVLGRWPPTHSEADSLAFFPKYWDVAGFRASPISGTQACTTIAAMWY